MAKPKQKPSARVQNRAIYSRMSYLYQAASLLASQQDASNSTQHKKEAAHTTQSDQSKARAPPPDTDINSIVARRFLTDLRGVSLKTQIRIDPSIKRTLCKYCDTLLIEGKSCTSLVENRSKGAKKPWADVLVMKCGTCGKEKRFPVSAQRQKRRPLRSAEDGQAEEPQDVVMTIPER